MIYFRFFAYSKSYCFILFVSFKSFTLKRKSHFSHLESRDPQVNLYLYTPVTEYQYQMKVFISCLKSFEQFHGLGLSINRVPGDKAGYSSKGHWHLRGRVTAVSLHLIGS